MCGVKQKHKQVSNPLPLLLFNVRLFEFTPQEDTTQTQGLLQSLITKVINNVQVTVKNIHIRYEDNLSVPGVMGILSRKYRCSSYVIASLRGWSHLGRFHSDLCERQMGSYLHREYSRGDSQGSAECQPIQSKLNDIVNSWPNCNPWRYILIRTLQVCLAFLR
jgi:hypothetical protein